MQSEWCGVRRGSAALEQFDLIPQCLMNLCKRMNSPETCMAYKQWSWMKSHGEYSGLWFEHYKGKWSWHQWLRSSRHYIWCLLKATLMICSDVLGTYVAILQILMMDCKTTITLEWERERESGVLIRLLNYFFWFDYIILFTNSKDKWSNNDLVINE